MGYMEHVPRWQQLHLTPATVGKARVVVVVVVVTGF